MHHFVLVNKNHEKPPVCAVYRSRRLKSRRYRRRRRQPKRGSRHRVLFDRCLHISSSSQCGILALRVPLRRPITMLGVWSSSRSRTTGMMTGMMKMMIIPAPLKHRFTSPSVLLPCNTHTRVLNSPFSRTTRVSRYQKGKTSLDFTEARDSEWQWHQLSCIQVCTSLQTDI